MNISNNNFTRMGKDWNCFLSHTRAALTNHKIAHKICSNCEDELVSDTERTDHKFTFNQSQ